MYVRKVLRVNLLQTEHILFHFATFYFDCLQLILMASDGMFDIMGRAYFLSMSNRPSTSWCDIDLCVGLPFETFQTNGRTTGKACADTHKDSAALHYIRIGRHSPARSQVSFFISICLHLWLLIRSCGNVVCSLVGVAGADVIDAYSTPRAAGGQHTTTYPNKRVTKVAQIGWVILLHVSWKYYMTLKSCVHRSMLIDEDGAGSPTRGSNRTVR